MRLYTVLLYFLQTALHVPDDTLIHHQEHIQIVITTSGTGRTVFANVRCRGGVGTPFRLLHVKCNYSLSVLLMMDEGIIRNM